MWLILGVVRHVQVSRRGPEAPRPFVYLRPKREPSGSAVAKHSPLRPPAPTSCVFAACLYPLNSQVYEQGGASRDQTFRAGNEHILQPKHLTPSSRIRPPVAQSSKENQPSKPPMPARAKATEPSAVRDSARTMPPTKKPRGRPPAANKVTKPAPKNATRRSSGKAATTAQSAARQALVDKSNTNASRASSRPGKDSLDDDEADILELAEGPVCTKPGPGRPKGSGNKTGPARKTTGNAARTNRVQQEEVPETQQPEPEPMEVDEEDEPSGMIEPSATMPDTDTRELASDPDASEVSLRRRLGELTKRHESLETRHRDLREVGVKEAERNFDRLRKQAEQNTTASNKLISQLKEELAAQSDLAKQGDEVRHDLESSEARVESLEDQVAELNKSLSQARAEIKTLSTKLAASRSAEAGMKAPGSALKSASGRGAAPTEAVQAAQAKEDLYGDLTGLIVRGIKRGDDEDVFDCIQTGRNGTLHFKLAVESADAAESYEDVQFTYRPQLDEDRDGELMDMLPDYLVEDIAFPRPHASKFYARVIKSLTERLE